MLRTLYSRLALTLFVLLCVVGLALVFLVRDTSALYQQEVAQKLNRSLAAHIVAEQALISDDEVDSEALEHLFHLLMVINPSIELYLLDREGRVLAFSAPEGKVRRARVDLRPVRRFLAGEARFPLAGDDPRDRGRRKVFSAARIPAEGPLQGYLYIILGSEKYDSIVQSLQGSYILRASSWVLAVAIGIALLLGLLVFSRLTRRLAGLSSAMQAYAADAASAPLPCSDGPEQGDEIDRLRSCFSHMVGRIEHQVQELERMDGQRRELVANISHDLRTPMTTLQGYIETLLMKGDDLSAAQKTEYLHIALGHARRLSQLITELFELAKLDACETVLYAEPFSLAELVQDVVQKYRLRAGEAGIRLQADVGGGVPMVHGDIAMMQRVLENLIDNALRHTTAGGHVSVGLLPVGDRVTVRVEDSGSGIPAPELERIFERFHRAGDNRDGGSPNAGLGLAIVRRILELHGATIQVQSQPDQGTVFSFDMPACHA